MLRYAVLIVRPEEAPNDIRVVPVRPNSSLGKIGHEILFGPEDILGRGRWLYRLRLTTRLFPALL